MVGKPNTVVRIYESKVTIGETERTNMSVFFELSELSGWIERLLTDGYNSGVNSAKYGRNIDLSRAGELDPQLRIVSFCQVVHSLFAPEGPPPNVSQA